MLYNFVYSVLILAGKAVIQKSAMQGLSQGFVPEEVGGKWLVNHVIAGCSMRCLFTT